MGALRPPPPPAPQKRVGTGLGPAGRGLRAGSEMTNSFEYGWTDVISSNGFVECIIKRSISFAEQINSASSRRSVLLNDDCWKCRSNSYAECSNASAKMCIISKDILNNFFIIGSDATKHRTRKFVCRCLLSSTLVLPLFPPPGARPEAEHLHIQRAHYIVFRVCITNTYSDLPSNACMMTNYLQYYLSLSQVPT